MVISLAIPALAKQRHALLIGNEAYAPEVGRLKNPAYDVRLIAASRQQVGFAEKNLTVVTNADRAAVLEAVEEYADRLANAGKDAVGFFYYSGHGAANQRDKSNYLIPVGVKRLDSRVWYKAIALNRVISRLSNLASNAAHFVVFDACRNILKSPTRGTKGFVPVSERRGMLIAFSTDPGETATDEGEGSGPYAAALAKELVRRGQHPRMSPVTVITNTAPAAAPEDRPKRNGSAKSLRVVVCKTTPTIPRPAPITAANRARGSRKSNTMRCTGATSPSASPRPSITD